MKYVKLIHTTPMNPVETFEGEFIEEKVARVVENKEPIEDGAPIIYTERKNGVIPAYNIRTDKWDIALTAMDQVNKNSKRICNISRHSRHVSGRRVLFL